MVNRTGARWARFFLCLLPFLALLSCPGQLLAKEHAESRVALVIGNGGYRNSPLLNPVHDARDMAAALKGLGFEVIERFDATQKEMNRAIAIFGEKLNGDTIGLFYYAGHGLQVRGKNYLIPVDAEISGETSIRAEAVDVDAVLDQLSASDLSIVILDACRNNPYERRFRSVAGGLAQMDAPKGSLIAYATAPGKTAFDGNGRNGLYTAELLKEVKKQGMPLEAVFKNVRRSVARATADQQIPWESSSLTGDFYFTPMVVSVPVTAPTVTAAPPTTAGAVDPSPIAVTEPAKPVVAIRSSEPQAPARADEPAGAVAQDMPPATAAVAVKSVEVAKPEATAPPLFQDAAEPSSVQASPPDMKATVDVAPTELASVAPVPAPIAAESRRRSFSWAGGLRYEGEWDQGSPNGMGAFFYENGDRYRGEVKDGRRHGRGRLLWARGGYWEGDFVDDKQILSGRMTIQTGDMTMIGEFVIEPETGLATGAGRLIWAIGDVYEGALVKGVKQGNGSFVWGDGQRYAGDWDKNLPNGKGAISYANGDSYEGEVTDGEPHGQGTYRRGNGDTYTGAWVKGLKHGHGRLSWAKGGYWEGEFRNDQQTESGYMANAASRPVVPVAADASQTGR